MSGAVHEQDLQNIVCAGYQAGGGQMRWYILIVHGYCAKVPGLECSRSIKLCILVLTSVEVFTHLGMSIHNLVWLPSATWSWEDHGYSQKAYLGGVWTLLGVEAVLIRRHRHW